MDSLFKKLWRNITSSKILHHIYTIECRIVNCFPESSNCPFFERVVNYKRTFRQILEILEWQIANYFSTNNSNVNFWKNLWISKVACDIKFCHNQVSPRILQCQSLEESSISKDREQVLTNPDDSHLHNNITRSFSENSTVNFGKKIINCKGTVTSIIESDIYKLFLQSIFGFNQFKPTRQKCRRSIDPSSDPTFL